LTSFIAAQLVYLVKFVKQMIMAWFPKAWQGKCPGFGWDRFNFLPSSWYGAAFWI